MIKISYLLKNAINDVIENHFDFFSKKKNVNGIGLGYKVINGLITKEPVLHVFVERKSPLNKLYSHDIVPKNFIGIKTDVIETGTLSTNSSNDNKINNLVTPFSEMNDLLIKDLNSNIRPIQPGCAISPLNKDWLGTLGCIVFDYFKNEPYLLSNNHVLADNGIIPTNYAIFSPNFLTYPYKKNMIARLTNFVHLNQTSSPEDDSTFNFLDIAIAKLLPNIKYKKEIYNVGEINDISEPSVDETVYKVGATSGYTEGTIKSVNCKLLIKDNDKYYFYKKQIFSSLISLSGDSGSLVFTKSKKAIGILMGGSEKRDVINPIGEILSLFNVHF